MHELQTETQMDDFQKILSYTRRAIEDYRMIEDGDRVVVGISGGKDSMAMLRALAAIRDFLPERFELFICTAQNAPLSQERPSSRQQRHS